MTSAYRCGFTILMGLLLIMITGSCGRTSLDPVNERVSFMEQDLKGGSELAKRTERILTAVHQISDIAQAYRPNPAEPSLSMDAVTSKRLEAILSQAQTPEELGDMAKILWLFKGSLPGNGECYAYIMEMACWRCIGKLARRSDEEAEYLLYEFREKFADDGGAREMINNILESRNPTLNHSFLKDFHRDDLITTIPLTQPLPPAR